MIAREVPSLPEEDESTERPPGIGEPIVPELALGIASRLGSAQRAQRPSAELVELELAELTRRRKLPTLRPRPTPTPFRHLDPAQLNADGSAGVGRAGTHARRRPAARRLAVADGARSMHKAAEQGEPEALKVAIMLTDPDEDERVALNLDAPNKKEARAPPRCATQNAAGFGGGGLLDAGASVDARNGEDMTALFVVSSMCPDREAFYQEEYAKRRVLGATKALAAGADANAVSTAERLVARMLPPPGHAKLVVLLIKRGANVEAEDKAGVTPFVLAVHERCEKCVLAPIEGGAKVDEARRLPNPSRIRFVKITEHLERRRDTREGGEAAKAKAEAKAELQRTRWRRKRAGSIQESCFLCFMCARDAESPCKIRLDAMAHRRARRALGVRCISRRGCEPQLNAWCDAHCLLSAHGGLYARFDTNGRHEAAGATRAAAAGADLSHERGAAYVRATRSCARCSSASRRRRCRAAARRQWCRRRCRPGRRRRRRSGGGRRAAGSRRLAGTGEVAMRAVDTAAFAPTPSRELHAVAAWRVDQRDDARSTGSRTAR